MKKFLFGIIASLSLFACSTGEKPSLEVANTQMASELPQEFIIAFTESSNDTCVKNGNDVNDCKCYSNEIINTFTVDDFAIVVDSINNSRDFNEIVANPNVGPKIINATMKCFNKD
ncbi:MAG: hypothetical protein IJ638_00745 [Alphaproteobacteria bacterium]|nr:hypothetical protein [Alphaproteobacteria bacterium]